MKRLTTKLVIAFFGFALCSLAFVGAQDTQPTMPKMPPPEKEHQWLEQLVGEWSVESEMTMAPGQEPVKSTGTETVRSLKGYWIVAEMTGTMMDEQFTSILTLGYDPKKKKYVGFWVGDMMPYLWKYEGTVDESGKVLTLETEGPCPTAPKISKFKEILEIKDKDHRTFTTQMQGDDGNFTTVMKAEYTRK